MSGGDVTGPLRSISRLACMVALTVLARVVLPSPAVAQDSMPDFDVMEASIPELQAALESGRATSVDLVDAYLARIAAYDKSGPSLNTIIRLHPTARAQTAAMDRERALGQVRGPLHGIPILLKDNYDTFDMPTTGSTLALAGSVPPDDGFQVAKLREAGAIILAKTNLHELAAGITSVSSLGGQTRNPYAPERNPGGSSGGTGAGVAASFAAIGWGSDTCGSIRIPSSVHNLVGLRPTKGLSSIDGIIPLSHTQDTGGPLARSVVDLAIALDATIGRDPADPATAALEDRELPRFQEALDAGALEGARIGALEAWLSEDGAEGPVTEVVRSALDAMVEAGAEVIDVTIPNFDSLLARTSVIGLEFAVDFAAYLSATPGTPIESLPEIVRRGLYHQELDGTYRRRTEAEERGGRDEDEYRATLERQTALRSALVAFMEEQDLDAIAYPTLRQEPALIGAAPRGTSCFLAAHSGLPAISAPAGFTQRRLPVGMELMGRPFDDARLVSLAYALELSTSPRRAPHRTPALVDGRVPEPLRFSVGGDAGWAGRDSPVRLDAGFTLDLPGGVLDYVITTAGVAVDDVHAIVHRVSGPGTRTADGALHLTAQMLDDLLEDRIELALYTAAAPLGAVRLAIQPYAMPR